MNMTIEKNRRWEEADIATFWNSFPCGDHQVGGLGDDPKEFFDRYDAFRYHREPHILRCLDEIEFADKQVLEIGLGEGADSEQMIRRGAHWTGIDLTKESCDRVQTRLALRDLPYEGLENGSALDMPFQDNSFDIVFSHGVLHHIPDIHRAQQEIARVLKKDGQLVMMVYAKHSINYLISIGVLRRIGLAAFYLLGIKPGGIYNDHLTNAKSEGLANYLKMGNFIHHNTDGPLNPYSKVYTRKMIEADFPLFDIERCHKEHMHAPPLPINSLPGGSLMGWHLWAHMRQKA